MLSAYYFCTMEPRLDHARRLNNIKTLVDIYGSRKKFCEASDTSYVHVSQMFAEPGTPGHRGVGYTIARKMETNLGLPVQCLDEEDGVKEFLQSGRAMRLPKLKAHDALFGQANASHNAYLPDIGGLSALQTAALQSIVEAMKDGRFSNANCMDALSKWTKTEDEKK